MVEVAVESGSTVYAYSLFNFSEEWTLVTM